LLTQLGEFPKEAMVEKEVRRHRVRRIVQKRGDIMRRVWAVRVDSDPEA
jgi:hypothetical protein